MSRLDQQRHSAQVWKDPTALPPAWIGTYDDEVGIPDFKTFDTHAEAITWADRRARTVGVHVPPTKERTTLSNTTYIALRSTTSGPALYVSRGGVVGGFVYLTRETWYDAARTILFHHLTTAPADDSKEN